MAGESGRARRSAWDMIPVQEAIDIVLQAAAEVSGGSCKIRRVRAGQEALGLVLAEPLLAKGAHPPFDASIFDGYAIGSGSETCELQLVGAVAAGDASGRVALQPGTCAWVTTGAPVPPGTASVVKIEDTTSASGVITVSELPDPGQGVRAAGCDVAAGAEVLPAGHALSAGDIGTAISAGYDELPVWSDLRVAVLSTGSELAAPGAELRDGQIWDSNGPMLAAQVAEAAPGAKVECHRIPDNMDETLAALQRVCAACDVVISSGGVSMGDRDFVAPSLAQLGTQHFGRVFMKPGKPTCFATVPKAGGGACLAFGLPGNPVSAWTTFQLFVRPTLRVLGGAAGVDDAVCPVTAGVPLLTPLTLDPVRPEYHRVLLVSLSGVAHGSSRSSIDPTAWWSDKSSQPSIASWAHPLHAASVPLSRGTLLAVSTGVQRSSRLLSTRRANGLLLLPPASATRQVLGAGERAPVLWLGNPITLCAAEEEELLKSAASHVQSPAPSVCGCGAVHRAGPSSAESHAAHPTGAKQRSAKPPLDVFLSVITVSTRASVGAYADESGPATVAAVGGISALNVVHTYTAIVPDGLEAVRGAVRDAEARWEEACSAQRGGTPHLILTSGGTGFSKTDCTPEAVQPLLAKQAPGFVHALLAGGLQHTPMAVLARPAAGVTQAGSLLVTLPGSVKAVKEGVQALQRVLPHALALTCKE